MQQIKNVLVKEPLSYNIMLWAACCLAFFAFLIVGELTIPAKGSYNKSSNLSLFDIAVDKRDYPQLLRITIRQLKTDPFCKGVKIFLGVTNRPVCPIVGITQYLAASHSHRGPLFVTSDRNELTRQTFTALLNPLLAKLHLDIKNYNTHSFRIGAATSAAEAHIPDNYIKMLGRWRSDAYQCYIRTPPQDLAALSKCLVTH